jgi:diacylglycerol O-acyltransferase
MPVPPIAVHLRIGIAITSYVDDLVFGIIGDFDAPVDVDVLAAGITDGVERLVGLNAACKRSRRIGNLMLLTS